MDQNIDKLKTTFELLPDWEERYRYIIDLGRKLEPLDEAERNEATGTYKNIAFRLNGREAPAPH